jgi:tRNA(Ile)-lysidine synthase
MNKLEHSDYILVEKFLQAFPEALGRDHVLVAVSGGSDSLALLHLLHDARSLRNVRATATAVHIDHGQREQSRDEGTLVERAAQRLDSGFVGSAIPRPADNSEADLRAQRYTELERIAERIGARWILTGHTRDDQIETVLMRLVRGAGRLGLAGIPARRSHIVRPLLDMTRSELRAYLHRREIRWTDDPSNDHDAYTRNRLRNDVIPTIKAAFGETALEHLPDLALSLGEEDRFLESQAARYRDLVVVEQGRTIDLAALAEVPAALRPRLLRSWLGKMAGGSMISRNQLLALDNLLDSREGSARLDVAGLTLERSYDRLSPVNPQNECFVQAFLYKVEADRSSRFVGPHGAWEVSVDPAPVGAPPRAGGPRRESLDMNADLLEEGAVLRPAEAGDRIELARHGMRSVRDIMIDRRLPRSLRSAWPVLASNESVLWVPGFAVARNVVALEEDTRKVRLDWKGLHI